MKFVNSVCNAAICVIWMPQLLVAQNSRDITAESASAVLIKRASEVLRPSLHGSIAGCFAAACHGSNSADGAAWTRSAKDWFSTDPHAEAYTALQSDTSRNLVRMLSRGKLNTSDQVAYEAFLEQKCTSCHANKLAPLEQRELGVECQSCHGPATAWGEVHWSRDWTKLGPSRFGASGMVDTQSLVSRAKLCTSCHVGDLSVSGHPREVDHEMIAAGHPPLHFEFESYWKRLPSHWDAGEDLRLHGEFSTFKRWQVGKLVQASSRIQLLADRAELVVGSNDSSRPWPELSEYSCYDCHHSLSKPSWRQQRSQDASAGFNWDPWSTAELESACIGPTGADVRSAATELRNRMQERHIPAPEVREIALPILRLLESQLGYVITAEPPTRTELTNRLQSLLQTGPARMEWESAHQWQAAAKAMASSLRFDASEQELSKLENGVLLRAEKKNSRWIDSPIDFDPQRFQQSRERLLMVLEKDKQP